MTKREQQRHSSLPSTIIPLLIGAPQTMAEGRVRSLTSPADAEGGEETVELNPPHQHQSSGTLPSIRTSLMSEARSRTTSFTNSISESAEPEDIRDLDTRHYTAGPAVFYGPIAGPSSIPHGQTQRFPIRSDPSFHASSSRSTGYRTTYGYPSPSPQIPLPRLRPSRWDEGEAGTSSRVPGHQIQTRPRSPLELELNRRTLHVGEPRMGERREEYGGRFGPNPGSQTRSMRDNNQDAGGSNLRGLSAQRMSVWIKVRRCLLIVSCEAVFGRPSQCSSHAK
jgi:hypothetical protein